jgi:hypothetical protein
LSTFEAHQDFFGRTQLNRSALKINRSTLVAAACIGLASVPLTGCYPGGAEYVDQLDLVYTNYNPSFSFEAQQTYALPDEVIFIDDNTRPTDPEEYLREPFKSTILSNLRASMNARGYTEVDISADPQLILFPTATRTVNVDIWYGGGYWDWWYGWGGGWYYPGYYPTYVSSYETGTLFVQMAHNDPALDPSEDLPVQWIGALNGLLQGNDSQVNARIKSSIDQMFSQSEYIRR